MTKNQKGSAYVMISGILYGLLGYLGMNIINHNIALNNMLFWRFLITSFIIGIVIYFKKTPCKGNLKSILGLFIFGALFYCGTTFFYFYASTYIGTGLAMTIFFIYPSIIILFNRVKYNTKISRIYTTSMIFTVIGMLLLVESDEFNFDLFGMFLAIIAAISYSSYLIYSKFQIEDFPPLLSTLIVSLGCCLIFFITSYSSGEFAIIPSAVWIDAVSLAILGTALPILLMLEGLKYIRSEKAAILTVLEPIVVVVLGVILLGEEISFKQCLGVFVMLSTAIIIQWDKLNMNDNSKS